MAKLTPRIKNWLAGVGGHIATASIDGRPLVVVVESAIPEGDNVLRFPLSEKQLDYIKANIEQNPRVAIGPGGIGCVRAAYQLKGAARIEGQTLAVEIDEIYSTKPGPEAGLRLDVLPYDEILKFETSRWKDQGPPK